MAKERLRLMLPDGPPTPAAIDAGEFAAAMSVFQPFEPSAHLAVAVSGGVDSMALVLLTKHWCEAVGASLTALIVDHGLRATSTSEAYLVQSRLKSRGISAEVLRWEGCKPTSDLQNAAREARYQLMDEWCRANGVLHLLVGHQADDHAETVLMRLRRGSGPTGLAGISGRRDLSACQLLRPLLAFPRTRLEATLRAAGLIWIEDPSNTDPRFERTKIRQHLSVDPALSAGLRQSATAFAGLRQRLEHETTQHLAPWVNLHPEGFAKVSKVEFLDHDPDLVARCLSLLLRGIGGRIYAPSRDLCERVFQALKAGRAITAGGCLVEVRGRDILIMREVRDLPAPIVSSASTLNWDQRFQIINRQSPKAICIKPWQSCDVADRSKRDLPKWAQNLPYPVRQTLPVIKMNRQLLVPRPGEIDKSTATVVFQPHIPVSGTAFFIA